MKDKLLSRDDFRNGVKDRDGNKCVFCGETEGLDAHHILERRLFSAPHEKSGYFLNNGATVCQKHHLDCEMTTISVEEVREAAGIKKAVLPEHLYEDQEYTKWGDIVLPNGQRLKGELFEDESVQKILGAGGVLGLYTNRVKYARTYHLPWSEGMNDDDRMHPDMGHFVGKEVVVTEKIDGENTTIGKDYIHARSIDGSGHPSRNLLKAWAAGWQWGLGDDERICGENAYAQHSIIYGQDNPLPHHFLGFSMWSGMTCLDWDTTLDNFAILGVTPVREMWRGVFDENAIKALYDAKRDWETVEGYVVRLVESFHYSRFRFSVAKCVRAGHVMTTKHHWKSQPVIPNLVIGDK